MFHDHVPGSSSSEVAASSGDTRWKLILEFCKKRNGGKLRQAHGLAVCSTGDIAVLSFGMRTSASLFTKNGEYKLTLKSSNPEGKLYHPRFVAVTSNNNIVITDLDQSTGIKIFDVNGSFVRSFSTLPPGEKTGSSVLSIGVSNQDEIIVGDWNNQCITIHTQSGTLIKKTHTPLKPTNLATNSHLIIISDWMTRKAKGMTRDGRVVFTIDRFKVDGKEGGPDGITCDSNDDLFIAVMQVMDESDSSWYLNTGHIHQYDSNGTFTRCIIRDLYCPIGLAMYNGKLYIANDKSILVYCQE